MRKEYHKLVRDAIPEIIRRHRERCEVIPMTEEQYRQALREKLIEEAREEQERRRKERGGFQQRLCLLWSE